MFRIRIWLAVVGTVAVLAFALPARADSCPWDSGICFGVDWKAATVEKIVWVDANARDENGRTPLHWAAAFNKNPEVIETLVQAGGDINAQAFDKRTPLHHALNDNGNWLVIETIVRMGGDVNARAGASWSPLHWVVVGWDKHQSYFVNGDRNRAVIEVLKRAGSDVNARNEFSNTPLHLAASSIYGNPAAIEALLKVGANPNVRNDFGSTPIDSIDEDENSSLKNTSAYWALNDVRNNFPTQ